MGAVAIVLLIGCADVANPMLTPLVRHVAFEQALQRRVDLKEALVEQHRGVVGDRCDGGERVLDERLLLECHHREQLLQLLNAPSAGKGLTGRRTWARCGNSKV